VNGTEEGKQGPFNDAAASAASASSLCIAMCFLDERPCLFAYFLFIFLKEVEKGFPKSR